MNINEPKTKLIFARGLYHAVHYVPLSIIFVFLPSSLSKLSGSSVKCTAFSYGACEHETHLSDLKEKVFAADHKI